MSHSRSFSAILSVLMFTLAADAAGPVCTYNDAPTSFGASFANNQESAQTAAACTAGSPTTAARLNDTSFARTMITPPAIGDFKFLERSTTANSTPPAFEMVSGIGQETKAFPDSLAVPVIAGVPAPGCDDLIAAGTGGVDSVERHLNRSWPLFGQTYYYGDYNQNPPNDPTTVLTSLSPYGKWAPYNPAQDYVYWDAIGKWGPAQGSAGTGGAYPIQVSGYAAGSGCTSAAAGLTVPERTKCSACLAAKGYYLHDSVAGNGDLKKSVFRGTILNDYPPSWVHLAWGFGYILNFQLHDSANNPIFPIARDTSQSSNGGGSGCSTSNIQHTGGNFEPVGSSNCSIAYPTFNWPAVQALGLSGVYNDQSNIEGSNSAWGSDGASATPAGDILTSGNWVNSFVNNTCKFCETKSVLYIGYGQPCGESRPAGLPVQTMAPCTGECAYVNPTCSSCAGQANYIAEAAHYLYTTNNVRTYFIGMGPHTGAMRRAAAEGHGKYFDGRDTRAFHDAFFAILTDLIGQAASSATSTVNAVQVSVAGQQELVPRFVARQQQGIWEGHLFKYFLFSEFAASCTKAGDTVSVPNAAQPVCTATCVCPGGSCTGRWLVDAQCSLITPDPTGFLYQATWNGSSLVVPTPAACVTSADCLPGKTCNLTTHTCPPTAVPAVPVWDANAQIRLVNWYQRNVYTSIDTNNDGAINSSDGDGTSPAGMYKITTSATAGAADLSGGVSDAVADALAPYMAIDGTATCSNIEAALGIALPGTAATRLRACARVILNYALGEDLFNEQQLAYTDPNYLISNRIEMLGDIFHSSPEDIGAPPSEADCVTSTRRCVSTLFNNVNTNGLSAGYQPLDHPATVIDPALGTAVANATNIDSYQAYYQDETFRQKRPHVSVFGANDGLVHAIQTSCFVNTSTINGTVVPNYWDGAGTGSCVAGSVANGSELWAFIPPDLLPKLGLLLLGQHHYFVDSSAMVRDIYTPAGTQSPNKRYTIGATPALDFKRVAIFGEREGGTHWFGLDVTDPTAPQFRWLFPQPNTEEELAVGQSWGDWVPNAAPVVPIRLAAPTALGTFPSYTNSDSTSVQFQEKWVVLLPGGHDPYGVVGKHVYMLDAYTGAKIFQTNNTATIKQDFSFAALPAAIPWGTQAIASGTPTYNNGFFDTAVYGDEGGQVWTLRFNDVGNSSTSLVTNWFFGRAYRQYAADDTGVSPYKMQHRTPFFQMASAARLNEGTLRAFIGSGDRANSAESGVGLCSIYNPLACGKLKCTMTLAENLSLNGNPSVSGVTSYQGDINATYATTWSETYTAGSAVCSPAYAEINACVSCTGGTAAATTPSPSEPQYSCTNTASGWMCGLIGISDSVASQRLEATTVMPTPNPNSDIGYFSRFLAFNIFDTNLVTPRSLFSTAAQALTYDGRALTETSLTNLFAANTPKTFNPIGNTTVNATVDGNAPGFFFYYPVIDERTATNSVVAQNCVSWYSMEPGQPCNVNADCSGGTCNTTTHTCVAPTACGGSATAIPARSAFLYQINASDGSTNCGLTSSSYIRTAAPLNAFLVPPPPPQELVSQNSKGQLQYSILAPAGQLSPPAAAGIGGSSTPFSFFYTIGTPRELEVCRHQYQANACYP
jgi:type IV pilus assembly protein PilY1